MELLFLVVLFLIIIAAESFLDNFWWIGAIAIIYLLFSIVRQTKEVGKDFDGGEIIILLMKIAAIAGVVWFIFFI
ncbi:MAG: hypothetical protein IJ294_03615 [Clostridia bacterium]|nr:hypothetical protein [Clostridia bacterium]